MISDVLFEATERIERYQQDMPECYEGCREHIEIVKAVMGSLQQLLDAPPGMTHSPSIGERLSVREKQWWRVCCEANVSRWVERLGLLGPVSPEELVGRLAGAIGRQQALLDEEGGDRDGTSGLCAALLDYLHIWGVLRDVEPVRGRLTELLPRLEHCNHALPVDYAEWLGLPVGATIADAVRAVHEKLQPVTEEELRREILRLASEFWNREATYAAEDALRELLNGDFTAEEVVGPICQRSDDYWLDQMARAALGLGENKYDEVHLDDLLAECRKAVVSRNGAGDGEQVPAPGGSSVQRE